MKTRHDLTRCLVVVVGCLIVAGLWTTVMAQDNKNPFIGTWKVNPEKSEVVTSETPPQSASIRYEADGMMTKVTVDNIAANGQASGYTYTSNFDGKAVPLTRQPSNGTETAAADFRNATTYATTYTRDGETGITNTVALAADGESLTVTNSANGNAVVYEKQ